MAGKRLRFQGIVGFANSVREELGGAVSAERLAALKARVEQTVQWVKDVTRAEGVTAASVAAPTRKAVEYLSHLDLTAVPASAGAEEPRRPSGVRFRGITAFLDWTLDELAKQPAGEAFERLWGSIRDTSGRIERQIESSGLRPEELQPTTRACRGWLAHFSDRPCLEEYRAAVARATPVFRRALDGSRHPAGELRIHFRPMKAFCNVRTARGVTHAKMPTPHVCFDADTLIALAEGTLRRSGVADLVMQRMREEPWRDLAARLEWLGGAVERTAGVYHDLAEAFDRVNAAAFGGQMPRPRLTWSRTFTFRKFGHYDGLRDTVMVSSTLDRADVPAFVVDFIVYHELLHKKLGAGVTPEGVRGHPRLFREIEQRFPRWREAQDTLSRLARRA